jgi:hypothetical protein
MKSPMPNAMLGFVQLAFILTLAVVASRASEKPSASAAVTADAPSNSGSLARGEAAADPFGWLGNFDISTAAGDAKGLDLSASQVKYIQGRYNVFLDAEKHLEAAIAQKKEAQPGATVITIPPHAAQTAPLYSRFRAEITAYLGAAQSAAFFRECGPYLAMDTADYGSETEEIVVQRNAGIYHVSDTVAHLTLPGLPAGANVGTLTRTTGSTLFVGGDLMSYRYLAAEFPSY